MTTKSILLTMAALLGVGTIYTAYVFTHAPISPEVIDTQVDLVISERAFLEVYIPHLEAAVVAAQIVLEKGTRLRPLHDIAAKITEEKKMESEYLKARYQALYGEYYTPTGAYISSLRDLTELSQDEHERVFLEEMIRHHDISVQLLQKSLNLQMDTELVEYSQKGIASALVDISSLRDVSQLLPRD